MNTLQLQFLISILAGWVNRGQQDHIKYLQEENRVLREQLGAKRLLFTDDHWGRVMRRIGSETEPPNLAAEKNTGCGHF